METLEHFIVTAHNRNSNKVSNNNNNNKKDREREKERVTTITVVNNWLLLLGKFNKELFNMLRQYVNNKLSPKS